MVDTFGQHSGGHRIRHYGLLASGVKADNLVLARKLLDVALAVRRSGPRLFLARGSPVE